MTTFPNWFDGQRYNFEEQLGEFKGLPNLRFLQVGAYTGDATVWLLDNILTHPTSTLIDVDTFKGSDESEHEKINFAQVEDYYFTRTSGYKNLTTFRAKSQYVLSSLKEGFDFIYIDGDHTAKAVAQDAIYAWNILKPTGILAFDDYLWGRDYPEHTTPKPAIDNFLEEHKGQYKLLVDSYQIWIQKNDN